MTDEGLVQLLVIALRCIVAVSVSVLLLVKPSFLWRCRLALSCVAVLWWSPFHCAQGDAVKARPCRLAAARKVEQRKTDQHNETCAGMADGAVDLLDRIASVGAEQYGFWPHSRIVQHPLAVAAVAIQKGNAMR